MNLPHVGDMPALSADFSFLSKLVFHGSHRLGVNDQFLKCFTGLIDLEMHNLALGRLPNALTEMPHLERLTLSNCGVVLDAEGQRTLVSLHSVVSLSLDHNPLGRTPDIQHLPDLAYLDLSESGLTEVPANLAHHNQLEVALFTGNQITELPSALFELPAQTANGFVFTDNPLSAQTRERIRTYYRKTAENFGVLAQPQDLASVQTLHPNLDDVAASAYFYSLPGTIAESRIALTREETELGELTRELAQWASVIPNDPLTGQPLEAAEQAEQETHREMFKEELLTAWRKWPTEDADLADFEFSWNRPLLGELPTLGKKLKSVLSLILINNSATAPRLGGFLEAFPSLDSLTIHKYDLGELPEAIFRMSQLRELNLPECRISLTSDTVAKLGEMSQLNVLNLRNNPLGVTPDLSNLQKLESLNLSGTDITEMPEGVLNNHQFDSVNLANNQIIDMPDALMQVPSEVGAHYNLRNNPFSEQSLATIRAYYHATGNTLSVLSDAIPPGAPPLPVED